jgi:FkbM family methyltransferase
MLAALQIGGNVPVSLVETAEGLAVRVDGRLVYVPSPLRWKLYRQGWEARLDRLAREYGLDRHIALNAQSVIVDVGANVGEFAHVAARYGARIYCIEPDPDAFASLKRNIAALERASAHEVAIWKVDGEVDFALASARADSSVFAESARRIKRRAATLAAFAREHGVERIDLIKCDAEGAEPEVLEGIGAFFHNVAAVALDTGPERRGERTHDACAEILVARGFRVIAETIGTRQMTYGLRPD